MSKISPILLDDTYQLMQLARETALAQGRQGQANRLTPIVDDLRQLVDAPKASSPSNTPVSSIMGQLDFRALLEATQKSTPAAPAQASPVSVDAMLERNRMVVAMAGANMSDIDVARQLGMSRDEVRMILNLNPALKPTQEAQG